MMTQKELAKQRARSAWKLAAQVGNADGMEDAERAFQLAEQLED